MAEQKDDVIYDKRLVTLNTRFGALDAKGWDAHLKKLPDIKAQSEEWLMFTEESVDGTEPTFAAIEQK